MDIDLGLMGFVEENSQSYRVLGCGGLGDHELRR